MVRKCVEVEIAEQKYPMNFSMGAIKRITNKYGSMKKFSKIFEKFDSNEDDRDDEDDGEMEGSIFEMVWVLSVLIEQGCKWHQITTGEEVKPLTEDEILSIVDMGEMKKIMPKMAEAISESSKREVEAESSKKEPSAE